MKKIFKHTPLYRFLDYCNMENVEGGNVLDCGAGGMSPPLSLFNAYNYDTTGIDLEQEQVDLANTFGRDNGQVLNVIQGDMTKLPFDDNTFDFVYSYNSIFHMMKVDIDTAVQEMIRVLKPNGLMFVNFLSIDDFRCGEGPHLGGNQYKQMDDAPVIHSYFGFEEPEKYFNGLEFVLKERRIIERLYLGDKIEQGFIDYILRKKKINKVECI